MRDATETFKCLNELIALHYSYISAKIIELIKLADLCLLAVEWVGYVDGLARAQLHRIHSGAILRRYTHLVQYVYSVALVEGGGVNTMWVNPPRYFYFKW